MNSPATPDGNLAGSNLGFYLAEYGRLRQEVVWLLKDYRALERNVVIAVAVSWAWLFEGHPSRPKGAWFLPALFAALGALRASGIFKQFGVFHEYLKSIGAAFSRSGDPGGWQHFSWKRTGWVSSSAIIFWIALICSALVVGGYEFFAPQVLEHVPPHT
jgi:hypothetical protein